MPDQWLKRGGILGWWSLAKIEEAKNQQFFFSEHEYSRRKTEKLDLFISKNYTNKKIVNYYLLLFSVIEKHFVV